jgi:hypothetical protein
MGRWLSGLASESGKNYVRTDLEEQIEERGSQYSLLKEMGILITEMARKLRVGVLANELAIRRKTSDEVSVSVKIVHYIPLYSLDFLLDVLLPLSYIQIIPKQDLVICHFIFMQFYELAN